jgi:tRNA pseudouridine38-40 synthase
MILDKTLSTILNEKISTIGAGRTDTGVHAQFFCAHFDSKAENLSSKKDLKYRLNRYLPPDISVSAIRKVKPDSNARFSALSRTYKYYVSIIKDPFCIDYSWYIHRKLDINAMNKASEILINNSDFTSFSKLHSNTKTNICNIMSANWEITGNHLVFTIKADRFLRNMVRAIVGTMIEIGYGKMDLKDFEDVIAARNRCKAGKSAPAKGLFLMDIDYPEELFI